MLGLITNKKNSANTADTGLLSQCKKGTTVQRNSRPLRVGLELSVDGTVDTRF
jgi:hypothetical protein